MTFLIVFRERMGSMSACGYVFVRNSHKEELKFMGLSLSLKYYMTFLIVIVFREQMGSMSACGYVFVRNSHKEELKQLLF